MKTLCALAMLLLSGISNAQAKCNLNGYYSGLSPAKLTTEISVDQQIASNSELENWTWIYPENAQPSDISNDVVGDVRLKFFELDNDEVAIKIDYWVSINRKDTKRSEDVKTIHIYRDFVISMNGGSTGRIQGDTMQIEIACSAQ